MKTSVFYDDIRPAADMIKAGGLVAVPTETVYGLAANGLDEAAVAKIYEVKGRPETKPLSLMVPGPEAFAKYGRDVPRSAQVLAERFWPGPLTIVVKATAGIPPLVLAGGDTVGLRCPDSEKTLELLRTCELPLAAPSANPSGADSPKTAEQVAAYFDGAIDGIIDGGPCGIGQESTIVDLSVVPYRVLRQGALPAEEIQKALISSLKIVGVTGGTGTGKTTALRVIEEMGGLAIDADEVYHDLCRDCAPMLEDIETRFPGSVENGVLQRKKLGAVVFSDPKALADLSAITDVYVDRAINEMMADHAAAGGKYAAVDAINLIGTELAQKFTALVGVVAPEEVRAARLVAREGIDRSYALLRIRAQKPDEYFQAHCDYIIRNDGSKESFRTACQELLEKILED